MPSTLPDYQTELAAFHCAFAAELRAIVRSLPMSPLSRVLDVGSGDGFYTRLLADRLVAPGSVTGLDTNEAYIELARQSLQNSPGSALVDFREGSLEDLSTQGEQWDVVWCAQSLYSLPEPVAALRQMARLVRPGGLVAVLENDSLHQVLLPWPSDLEIALRTAELVAFEEESDRPSKFYVGRRLPSVFAEAGLEPLWFRTQCIDCPAPLESNVSEFLELYLADLMDRSRPHLSDDHAVALAALIDPASDRCLQRQPHFTMSWLNVLAWGRRN